VASDASVDGAVGFEGDGRPLVGDAGDALGSAAVEQPTRTIATDAIRQVRRGFRERV
jgi:hypothetical protein